MQSTQGIVGNSPGDARPVATTACSLFPTVARSATRKAAQDERQGHASLAAPQAPQAAETTDNPHAESATKSLDFTARRPRGVDQSVTGVACHPAGFWLREQGLLSVSPVLHFQ